MKWIGLLALCLPLVLFADARIDPDECHVPWDSGNTDNEFKFQNCDGFITQYNGGGSAHGDFYSKRKAVRVQHIEQLGWDRDNAAQASLRVITSGTDSGTDCTLVDADGNTYTTRYWRANTLIERTKEIWSVDIEYNLYCDYAQVQQ